MLIHLPSLQEEQERIAKYVEKKAQELEALSEDEYAKQLRASKEKDPSYGSSSLFNAVGVYLGITDSLPSRPGSDQKQTVDEKDALLGDSGYYANMLGRTAKHRSISSKVEKVSDEDLEGGRRARADSRASSSGSSAEEEESLSSDDSDVELVRKYGYLLYCSESYGFFLNVH